jgi:C-terminal processing protease CtpA/Prc
MKQAFRNLAESGDDKDQETLDNLVMKIIEKEYSEYTLSKYILTIAMKNLVQTERDKVLAYLQPRMLTLINDNEGLRLFC